MGGWQCWFWTARIHSFRFGGFARGHSSEHEVRDILIKAGIQYRTALVIWLSNKPINNHRIVLVFYHYMDFVGFMALFIFVS
jgi:hypothetical protein